MSFENYEESSHGLDLDLLTISFLSQVLYPRRSGPLGKSNDLRLYLTCSQGSHSFWHKSHTQHHNPLQCKILIALQYLWYSMSHVEKCAYPYMRHMLGYTSYRLHQLCYLMILGVQVDFLISWEEFV